MSASESTSRPERSPTSPALSERLADAGLTVRIDDIADSDWDHAALAFLDTSYDQTALYGRALWGRRDSHLALAEGNRIVAGARVVLLSLPGIDKGLALVRFGPFWRRAGRPADPDLYRLVIEALAKEYCDRRGHLLTIFPRPSVTAYADETAILAECGFAIRRRLSDPNRYLVDTTLSETDQLASLDQKWRYNLRRALSAGLEIGFCESEADIAAFVALHGEMRVRKKFGNLDPVHLLPAFRAGFPDGLKPRIVLARHESRPIVGAVISLCGDTAYYLYGASHADALPLKAGYALQWWIAGWLRGVAVNWYDLGGEGGEQGLRQFKAGFVGRRGRVLAMAGEYDLWRSRTARLGGDSILALRAGKRLLRAYGIG